MKDFSFTCSQVDFDHDALYSFHVIGSLPHSFPQRHDYVNVYLFRGEIQHFKESHFLLEDSTQISLQGNIPLLNTMNAQRSLEKYDGIDCKLYLWTVEKKNESFPCLTLPFRYPTQRYPFWYRKQSALVSLSQPLVVQEGLTKCFYVLTSIGLLRKFDEHAKLLWEILLDVSLENNDAAYASMRPPLSLFYVARSYSFFVFGRPMYSLHSSYSDGKSSENGFSQGTFLFYRKERHQLIIFGKRTLYEIDPCTSSTRYQTNIPLLDKAPRLLSDHGSEITFLMESNGETIHVQLHEADVLGS